MPRAPRPAPPAPEGTLLGLPFDWRRPTLARARARLWQPGGPLLTPKVFGWGYGLNLAHPAGVPLLLAIAATVTLALLAR